MGEFSVTLSELFLLLQATLRHAALPHLWTFSYAIARKDLDVDLWSGAAQVLGIFGNGRIEAFLKMRELQPEDMGQPDMAAKIAQRLRQLHQHAPTNVPKHVPLFDDLQLL